MSLTTIVYLAGLNIIIAHRVFFFSLGKFKCSTLKTGELNKQSCSYYNCPVINLTKKNIAGRVMDER